ncbi:MAG: 6,7-dimethyl-8-ribityllumazine synthase [Hyphomicrobiaceae bacterium]|nr:MAG: 6,7-dimethyl-8-ribityllumazine synthase [Hyphomicrobiaceae bacterium]
MAGRSKSEAPASTLKGVRVLIIEARFYPEIADELAKGAIAEIEARGATYERVVVPGALEIPQALEAVISAKRIGYGANPGAGFQAAVALGCVIRGETSHYEIVCNNANHWLMHAAMTNAVAVGNGILTVDSPVQAHERARGGRDGKGGDAARAALRLVEIERHFRLAVTA